MKEVISNSCQVFIQLVNEAGLYNLAYFSIFIITLIVILISIKIISIYIRSQRLSLKLKNNMPHTEKLSKVVESLDLSGKTHLIKSNELFAFCYGIKNAGIYISSALVSRANTRELEAILRHEQYHLVHKDTLVMLVISIMQFALKFIPITASFSKNIHIDLEIKADTYVVKEMGDRRPLLSIIKKILKEPGSNFLFAPAIGNYDTLGPRIYALTSQDFKLEQVGVRGITSSVFIFIFLLVAVLTPVYATELRNQEEVGVICPQGVQQNASFPYTPVR